MQIIYTHTIHLFLQNIEDANIFKTNISKIIEKQNILLNLTTPLLIHYLIKPPLKFSNSFQEIE